MMTKEKGNEESQGCANRITTSPQILSPAEIQRHVESIEESVRDFTRSEKTLALASVIGQLVDRLRYLNTPSDLVGKSVVDVEDSSRDESSEEILLNEPPYNEPCTTDYDDLLNFGFGGYGKVLNQEVSHVKDVRMLVNYYSYLITNYCKECFERAERDHGQILKVTTYQLLTRIREDKLCKGIPVSLCGNKVTCHASEIAGILLENCFDRGNCVMDYELQRDGINILVGDLQYYFYGHIESRRPKKQVVPNQSQERKI